MFLMISMMIFFQIYSWRSSHQVEEDIENL